MFGPKPHAGTQYARKGLGMRLVNDLLKKWSPKPTSRTLKKKLPKRGVASRKRLHFSIKSAHSIKTARFGWLCYCNVTNF